MHLIIKVIDELPKLEMILSEIKEVIDDNGLITMHEVDVI
jgi:PII-like signaling protein